MYTLKISATRTIIISVKNIKITVYNKRIKNVLNCQIRKVQRKQLQKCLIFLHSSKILFQKMFWTFDVEKLRTIILNIAKVHNL